VRDSLRRLLALLRSLLPGGGDGDPPPNPGDPDDPPDGEPPPDKPGDEPPPDDTPPDAPPSDPEPEEPPSEEPTPEPDEPPNDEGDDDIGVEWPPYVGSSDAIPWPEEPDDPHETIEVRLYWPADEPWVETACHQCVKYLRYCLLDAFGGLGYDVDVSVHPEGLPKGADFSDWYWQRESMAKDANILLDSRGPPLGSAGGHGGWVNHEFFEGWGRDPDDPIKNVGGDGDFDGPTAGVITVLHETGHCLGLGHIHRGGNQVKAWGKLRTTPMNDSGGGRTRTRYIYEYHPSVKGKPPKVRSATTPKPNILEHGG